MQIHYLMLQLRHIRLKVKQKQKNGQAIRVSADVWIIKNRLKKNKKYTNMASSNADAHKCKFDRNVLAPTVIAVLNRLFSVSAERHHPASQEGPCT